MMALIDDRGRVFGRVNLIDAGVLLLIVLIGAGVYTGYRLLRLPRPPVITAIEPATQPGGRKDMRLVLKGQNFLPFMRVFFQRSENVPRPLKELNPDSSGLDQFVLVNYSQGRLFAESTTAAEVWLPEQLGPGTYDMVLFNETQIVLMKKAAFTLTAAPPPPPKTTVPAIASVRAYGAFVAVDRDHPPRLTPGLRLPSGSPEPWAEILSVEAARPDTAVLHGSAGDFPAPLSTRLRIPAVLRLHCLVDGLNCTVPGANIAVGNVYPMQTADKTLSFQVEDLGPDAPEVVREALVDVRFFMKPEIARLVRANDTDVSKLPDALRMRRSAVLRSRTPAEETTATLNQSDGAQSYQVPGKVVTFTAKLAMPLMHTPSGWFYRGQPIKAGNNLTFETTDYNIRGMIFGVELGAADAVKSSTP